MASIEGWHISQQHMHILYARSFFKYVFFTLQERFESSGDHLSVFRTKVARAFTQVNHALYLRHSPRQNSNIVSENDDKSEKTARELKLMRRAAPMSADGGEMPPKHAYFYGV